MEGIVFAQDVAKQRARDKRLQNTYGITLEQYNQILEAQGGKCAICGRPATDFSVSLAVDHEHFKVKAARNIGEEHPDKWFASTRVQGTYILRYANTKAEAVEACKKGAMPYSVRGLLCPGRHGPAGTCCNRNLGRVDNIEWMDKALFYLRFPPARKVLCF